MPIFTRATKMQAKLRMALTGISNSGKTWTALSIATGLGGSIALIDTERGSASKYAEYFAFDVLELENFHPEKYIEAIEAAGASGYAICIIDSLSHAWVGEGGALDLHTEAAKATGSANSYMAWREITPLQNQLVEAVLRSPCHVLATLRSKAEYTLEKDQRGKSVPRKIGLAPIQRPGLEYEFDLFGVLDDEHTLTITKSRFPRLSGRIGKPGIEFGRILATELHGAVPHHTQQEISIQAAKDLYGDPRDIPDFTRGMPKEPQTPPSLTRDTTPLAPDNPGATNGPFRTAPPQTEMLGVEHDASPPQKTGGATFLRQIEAAWQVYGLTPEQITAYWMKTCQRFRVEAKTDINTNALQPLLREVEDWITKRGKMIPREMLIEETRLTGMRIPASPPVDHPAWRTELADVALSLPESEEALHQEIAVALYAIEMPDEQGQELLVRVQACVSGQGNDC